MDKTLKTAIDELKRTKNWQTVYEEYFVPVLNILSDIESDIDVPPILEGLSIEQKIMCKMVLLYNLRSIFMPLSNYGEVETKTGKVNRYY